MRNPFETGKSRSLAGLALAAVIAPFLLALTGCLKVPIGDPEKSQIDPALSGVWSARDPDGDFFLWLMEPYDARTWLVTIVASETAESTSTEAAAATPQVAPDALTLLEQEDTVLSELGVFKAWLAPIGATRFLVLEPKTLVSKDDGMTPKMWFVYAVTNKGADALELRQVNPDFKGLDDAHTPAEAEAVIARSLDNPKLFTGPWTLTRLAVTEYGRVEDVLKNFNIGIK